ncbi:hypothetical protein Dsin_021852 [Dipteronia sinensis]|uniref:Glutaredoxin domain-containing protein n=1 Tax=Dipteronia sinensis TaxID=43782 RepID=A0AAE0A1B1_9ROSI|nr:hypothetical protein Dsin_021852 [Dipteronia sinensis]
MFGTFQVLTGNRILLNWEMLRIYVTKWFWRENSHAKKPSRLAHREWLRARILPRRQALGQRSTNCVGTRHIAPNRHATIMSRCNKSCAPTRHARHKHWRYNRLAKHIESRLHIPDSMYEMVSKLASSNAVVMFSVSGYYMCVMVKRLLFRLGVSPIIVELDQHAAGPDIQTILFHLASDSQH